MLWHACLAQTIDVIVSIGGALTASAVNTTALTASSLSAASLNATNLIANTLSTSILNSAAEATSSLTVGGGAPILAHLSMVSTLAFASFPANGCLTQTVLLLGTSDGDTVALGIPNVLGAVDGVTWFGWASAQDTVSIRGCNATTVATATPAPAAIRVDVWKHE